ncbi:MAG: CoA pyrophosphatase [Acidaminobacteraceae bacterium]
MYNYADIKNILINASKTPNGYKSYSILIPLVEIDGKKHLLYEKRSANLNSQPGEVCFPGGKLEAHENSCEAAIRETCEEIGVEKSSIEILGEIQKIITPFNLIISCYVGFIKDYDESKLNLNTDEVENIFTIPLDYLLDNEGQEYKITSKLIVPDDFPYHMVQNGDNYNWKTSSYPVIFIEHDDHIVWGITARITRNFIQTLKL